MLRTANATNHVDGGSGNTKPHHHHSKEAVATATALRNNSSCHATRKRPRQQPQQREKITMRLIPSFRHTTKHIMMPSSLAAVVFYVLLLAALVLWVMTILWHPPTTSSSSTGLSKQKRVMLRVHDESIQQQQQQQIQQHDTISTTVAVTTTAKVVAPNQEDWHNSALVKTTDTDNNHHSNAPTWMKNYFRWHAQQMARLQQYQSAASLHSTTLVANNTVDDDLHDFQVLVVKCLQTDRNCGGTADRLKPLPLAVMLAAKLKRVLWIHWERPCALQEFLVPPTESSSSSIRVDWRVPPNVEAWLPFAKNNTHWLADATVVGTTTDLYTLLDPSRVKKRRKVFQHHQQAKQQQLPAVLAMTYQAHNHGAGVYNEFKDSFFPTLFGNGDDSAPPQEQRQQQQQQLEQQQSSYDQVFRDCWHAFFQPSPAVQIRIDQARAQLNLTNDKHPSYVAVHIRALYQQEAGPKKTYFVARNAVHCASQFRQSPDEPILVSTDSINSTMAALNYAREFHPSTIVVARGVTMNGYATTVTAAALTPVLHLDRGTSFLSKQSETWTQESDPAAYYDTFVDLYLLAQARCITFHLGNYGKWANLLSANTSCASNHLTKMCKWKETL